MSQSLNLIHQCNLSIEYLPENTTQNNAGGLNFWRPFGSSGGYKNFVMHIAENRNVGIGTGNPKYRLDVSGTGRFTDNVGIGTEPDANFRLSVCGTIRSTEWVVFPYCWPDYVFSSDYKLTPLKERKDFIYRNSHLPYIQSATEVVESGANMFQTVEGILRNTEDIYLYLFEMDERIRKLEEENAKIKKENDDLRILIDNMIQ